MAKANGHYQQFNDINTASVTPAPGLHDNPIPSSRPASSPPIVHVDSAVLPDGTILDLVRRDEAPDELSLLTWKNEEFTTINQIEHAGRVYAPPALPPEFVQAVQLPVGLGPLLSARELIAELGTRVRMFLDLQEEDAFLLAVFILCTFFPDRLLVAPYLEVCGPYGSGKSALLRFLHCVTRRGVRCGLITGASLYQLTHTLAPTLLIDEADFTRDKASQTYMRLLRAGCNRGDDVYVNGQRYCIYGPKVICSRTPIPDAALASRAIHINMLPSRKKLAKLYGAVEQELAREMQAKMQRFRLEHLHDVRIPEHLHVSQFTPRMGDIALSLAAPIANEPELVERLLSFLSDESRYPQFRSR